MPHVAVALKASKFGGLQRDLERERERERSLDVE